MDYCFVRRLLYFLAESENIEPEKKEKFLNDLDEKDYKRIDAMMTQLLYTADEDGKATLILMLVANTRSMRWEDF